MNKYFRLFASVGFSMALVAATVLLSVPSTMAQCSEVISGLRRPLGITQSNQNNLIVSETGTLGELHSGRISIVDPGGSRRTLLSGLPSATSDVGEPSGPSGVYLRGRTLYVVIGVGNTFLPSGIPNPNPSSPIFSSLLAIHFSANVEKRTSGFTLSFAHQQALAAGEQVRLSNGGGDKVTIELVANFPDFTPNPLPFFQPNIRISNPFDLVAVGNQLYVTDGGMNLVWQVDINSGAFSALATFPPIRNPLFGTIGGPFIQAVPTGIAYSDGQLLVTLFTGFPFPPGASVVEQIDPLTGDHAPFITGLKTAIDVLPITEGGDTDYLVLQHSSGPGPFFSGPGLLLRFETPSAPPSVIANCLSRPTSMTLDEKTGTLYVTELTTMPSNGRIVAIPVAP